MRRTLTFFVLTAIAAISIGCGSDSGSNTANAPGTTTYGNSTVSNTTSAPATTASPSGGGTTVGGAAPKPTPTAPGIKPPTDK